MCSCCNNGNSENSFLKNADISLLDQVFNEYNGQSGSIISILQKAQDIYGYLPIGVLEEISLRTGVKKSKVYGIVTFYTQFRLKPVGRHMVLQCHGTACHVNGSEEVGQALRDELGIVPGGTTEDGMFTLENVACLGCCSLSPVIMIDGVAHGNLTPGSAVDIIRDIYKEEKAGGQHED